MSESTWDEYTRPDFMKPRIFTNTPKCATFSTTASTMAPTSGGSALPPANSPLMFAPPPPPGPRRLHQITLAYDCCLCLMCIPSSFTLSEQAFIAACTA